MMNSEARKAAVAAYKERKVVAGIYRVCCEATGETWVGQWPAVATIKTRIWFTLRQGAHPNRALQEAWRANGEDAFTFEILETLEEESSDYIRDANLKKQASHWREKLGAHRL